MGNYSTGKNVGPSNIDCLPTYSYPKVLLDFLRARIPGNIVGKFRADAHPINLQHFCENLELPKLLSI